MFTDTSNPYVWHVSPSLENNSAILCLWSWMLCM